MNITLVNPASPFLIRQDVMPPLGLWYLSAVLKRRGHNVRVVDLGLKDEIPQNADVYGVTGTSAQIDQLEIILYRLRDEKGLKVVGGSHATLRPWAMLQMGFDTAVCHEGEEVIAGVVEEKRKGVVFSERILNIDDYFPDRSEQKRYHYEIDRLPAVTMVTSRGCPYNCAFCSKDVWGRRYVARSVESVTREIAEIERMGYHAIMFYDDTFVIGHDRLRGICSQLRKYKMVWRAFVRTDEVNEDILRMMKVCGCAEIGVGIESGSQQILDNIHKKETIEDHLCCIRAAHKVGLRVKGFVIVGLPGESWQTIAETDAFLERVQLDDLDISILSVYPGSDIFKHSAEYDVRFGDPVFYKGKPGKYCSNVSTSRMNNREITLAREALYRKHKKGVGK